MSEPTRAEDVELTRGDREALAAWDVPAPPAGLVDRVMARVAASDDDRTAGVAAEPPAAAAPRRRARWTLAVAAVAVAAAAAAAVAIAVTRAPAPSGRDLPAAGELSAAAPSVVAIAPGTVVEAEAGAVLRWRRDEGGALHVVHTAGAVTYRHEPGVHLVVDAAWVAIETDEAFLRVEVPMSPSRKRAVAIGATAALGAVVAVAVYEGRAELSSRGVAVQARGGDVAVTAEGEAPAIAPPTAVARQTVTSPRRLPDEASRAELREAIARARATRELRDRVARAGAAGGAGAASASAPEREVPPPAPAMDPDEIRTSVREVIPMLAECYTMAPPAVHAGGAGGELTVEMTVSGEPDVGTVIEDATLSEGDAHLLADADFTECLRQTLLSVEMPPLSAGGSVVIRYPFAFADQEPEEDVGGGDGRGDGRGGGDGDRDRDVDGDGTSSRKASSSPDAELLAHAQNAAQAGRYNDALRYARRALERAPDDDHAHAIAAVAACNLRNAAVAAHHAARLKPNRQQLVRQACLRNGVELP